MQIVAVLAVLGATLGQPVVPPDQDTPPTERQDAQQADTESRPADEQPAEQQQAEEQQQLEADSSAAGEQPAATESDDGSAGLDEATSWRLGPQAWQAAIHHLIDQYLTGSLQYRWPFAIRFLDPHSRQPAVQVTATVEGSRAPGWDGVDEQVRTWLCEGEVRDFIGFGGVIVVHLTDGGGASRTVTLTGC
jgi:hypothetical protein